MVVFLLTSQNLSTSNVNFAAFPVPTKAQCRVPAGILNFREKSSCLAPSEMVQFTPLSQQRTKRTKLWEGKVGENRICEMHCYPPGSLRYTLTSKHVHIIHQSLMLKCTRDERRALNNTPTEWGSGYLHSVHGRSICKNRYSA